jgi:hypothetical protein
MHLHRGIPAALVAGALAFVMPSPVAMQAQAPAAAGPVYTPPPSSYVPPRTAWGDPDLQGMWDYQSRIPMQRPAQFAGKPVLTPEELEEWIRANPPGFQGYEEWWANRNFITDYRTSLIVDPPDGRIPALTPEATKRMADARAARTAPGRVQYESWEDFGPVSRCIALNTPGGPQQYNSGVLWMQTPGWVVMFRERLDTRLIPLDGRPHLDDKLRQWGGDSRGYWEGNTLVVETKNFAHRQTGGGVGSTVPQGISFGNIQTIERFVPISPTTMHYYATFTDATTWTRPWTFMLPWERDDDYQLLEYACHEANLSIENALRGERYLELEAAKKASEK